MDDQQEYYRRRKAIRLILRGVRPKIILELAQRSRAWLSKWVSRFNQDGLAGLKSLSRRPRQAVSAYSARMAQLIVRIRLRLNRQKVGLIGPRAIRREIYKLRLQSAVPSLSTIQRVLRARGLARGSINGSIAFCPLPRHSVEGILHAMDWTCRYLENGWKVYAFHTLNLHTRGCVQTIADNKNSQTVREHVLDTWKTLGIPQFLQLDNDAAFCGGYKVPRVFGQLVRLCLYIGIELIFLPVAEPERNSDVERLNGLWSKSFWERRRF